MTKKGAGTGGPTAVTGSGAEEAAQPALIAAGPPRRTFTVEQKQAIIEAYEAADPAGRRALLQLQRVSASTLRRWRRMAEAVPGTGHKPEAGAPASGETVPGETAGGPGDGGGKESAAGGSGQTAGATAVGPGPAGSGGELGGWSQILHLQRALVVRQDAVSAARPGTDENPYPLGEAGRAAAIDAAVGRSQK